MNSSHIEDLVFDYIQKRAQMLFFILDTEGRILEANKAAHEITGRNVNNAKFRDLVVDFSGSWDLGHLLSNPGQEHLIHIQTHTGLPQSFYFYFERMRDKTLAFGRMDAEEMQSMEKEILSLNRDLNNLTRELHKKNVQLKKLNEEKNRFLGMAAHDLRKPIGLILAYAEFLIEETDGLLSDEHMEFLDTIYKRCHLMKGLVDDFLDISAIEAGKFELDLQWVNILTVLKQSLALNHLQAEKKGVNLEVQTEEKIPALFIDAPKIEQVITNLISNAIEHSEPEAEILVDLAFDQKNIVFSVRDSGPGIAPHEMERLFQPFGKASSKKSGGAKSTGLGLMISRKIIEAHNGDIWVDSQLGSGTLISFYLPHHMDKS